VRKVAPQKIGMRKILLRTLTQIIDNKRRVDLQEPLSPSLGHVPIVEVVLKHLIV
jgi:hypothetical protein